MTEPTDGWTDPSGRPGAPPGSIAPPGGWGGYPGAAQASPQPGYGPAPGEQPGWGWGTPAPLAPKPGVVPLRPLGLGELLDGAVSIIRRYPKPTLGLSAVIALVATVINTVFAVALQDAFTAATPTNDASQNFGVAFSAGATTGGAGGLVSFLAGLVLTGVMTAVVGRAVLGRDMTLGEAWQQVRPQLLRLLGLSLLTGLLILIAVAVPGIAAVAIGLTAGPAGLVIAIPLGIAGLAAGAYVYVRLSLAPAALVLERTRVVASMRRSGVLVRGSWWRILGILLLTTIIGTVVSGVLQVPFGIVAVVNGNTGGTVAIVVGQIGAGLATCLVAPFTTGVHALLYVDRRMRAEGLDVALRSAAAEAPTT